MITTVFFDWGGVLADDPGDDFLSMMLRGIGATEQQINEIHATYMRSFMRGDMTEHDYWQTLKESYGFSIDEDISKKFFQWSGLIVNETIKDLVSEIREKQIKTALLSNVIEPTYNALEQSGHYKIFDVLIASCKAGYAKPQQEIYDTALAMAGTTAAESLFIDDKQSNLDPAVAMGFKTVLAQNPSQIIKDVKRFLIKS